MYPRTIIDVVDDHMLVFDPKEGEDDFYFHGRKQVSLRVRFLLSYESLCPPPSKILKSSKLH
jgi:hypothetical protein